MSKEGNQNQNNVKEEKIFFFLFLIMVAMILISFVNARGASDVDFFIGWLENAEKYGVIQGFGANADMYPPILPLLLYVISKCLAFCVNPQLMAIRVTVLGFLFLSCICGKKFWKDNMASVLVFLAFLVSSTEGYLDIITFPFGIWAFSQMKKMEHKVLMGLALCIWCLIKYQPLIIMPVVLCLFISLDIDKKKVKIDWKSILYMGLGALIPLVPILIVYKDMFWDSIVCALSRDSGNVAPYGLNFGWLVQYVYERMHGMTGEVQIIWHTEMDKLLAFKYIFWIAFLRILILTCMAKKKDYVLFLKASLAIYILYYLFGTNVHETHLFVGTFLSISLYMETKTDRHKWMMVYTILMYNCNLLMFYGMFGKLTDEFPRVLGSFDPTVLVAAINVIIGCYMCYLLVQDIWKTVKNIMDGE
ncbi:MAG: hypothetical protein ACI4FV_06200 [Lachnospiraceae bacterium]